MNDSIDSSPKKRDAETCPLHAQLLAEVRAEYPIVEDSITFGDHEIFYWRPADPEAILDDETLLSSHDELPWQPYWAQAWDASVGMSHFLSKRELTDQLVLDLGCGLGLTTALLLARRATVVCGDNAPPALKFAKLNTWCWKERVTIELIDWHKTQLDQSFQLIVGSDIVYDRREVKPLDRFFRNHLQPDGRVILSDPSRPMTREFLAAFQQLGWVMTESLHPIEGLRLPTRIVEMELN